MRVAPHKTVLLGLLLVVGPPLRAGQLQLAYQGETHQLDTVEIGSQAFLSLNQISGVLGLDLEALENRVLVHGAGATLEIFEGRPLVRVQQEYILLSESVVRRGSRWLVPIDFVDSVLSRTLNLPVELASEETGKQEQMSVQVLNSGNRVSLVFLPSRKIDFRVEESETAIRVQADRNLQFLRPRVRPEPSLVSSLDCIAEAESTTCEIIKGLDFRSYRSAQPVDPPRLLIDIYSTAVAALDPVGTGRNSDGSRERKAVTIDPGHGGEERGVTVKGVFEKDLTAQISRHLVMDLQRRALVADATRTSDFNPSLEQRSSVANGNRSSVFLSVHVGGSYSAAVRGPVVFTHEGEAAVAERSGELVPWQRGQQAFSEQSLHLARLVQERLNQLFGTNNSPARAPLAVLAPVQGPAVLVEAGYLTHPQDAERLQKPEFREAIAAALADAIEVFLR